MSERKWYAPAPVHYLAPHKFEFDITNRLVSLERVGWPRQSMWQPVFDTIEDAAESARGDSFENGAEALCLVEIVTYSPLGWEIKRSLPVVFLRGDMYRVVAGLEEDLFLKELANE